MCIRTVTYMCRKGHYYTDQPPAGIQSSTGWCHPCPDGSFMDSEEHSQGQCKQCLKCYSEKNQYYKKRCNRNGNSECETCPEGKLATQEGDCHSPTTTIVATTTTTTTTTRTTSKTTEATEASTARPSTTASGSPAHTTIQSTSTTASPYTRVRNFTSTYDRTSEKVTTELPATSYVATNVDNRNVANASNLEEDGELPIDEKVAPLATLSALSTAAFLLLLLLFCVKTQKRRRSCALWCSKQRMSCVDHVYAEPYDYDQPIYLDAPVGSSGASSSHTSTSSHYCSSIYDYAQTAVSLLEAGYERPSSLCRCCQRDGVIGDGSLCRLPITSTEATLEGNDIVAEDIMAGQSGSSCRGSRDYAQSKAEWQDTAGLSVSDSTQCGSLPL